jgi:diguanylate cyclase (GGDEF)-like protein/PAS domain S-box-containing protein
LDEAPSDELTRLSRLESGTPVPRSAGTVPDTERRPDARALHLVAAELEWPRGGTVQRAFEAIPVAAVGLAFDGTVLFVNDAGRGSAGLDDPDFVGHPLSDVLDPVDAHLVTDALSGLARGAIDNARVAATMTSHAGRRIKVTLTLAAVRDEAGAMSSAVVLVQDLSERDREHAELRHRASRDGLTELPNRTEFVHRVGQAMARARRRASWSAVLFLDLDGFKAVNDNLGHAAGDELLFSAAGRISAVMRPEDTLARYGGDEFTVLCEDLHGAEEADAIAQRVLSVFRTAFLLSAGATSLSASIGVAVVAGGATNALSVIEAADAAMYASKHAGRARYVVHELGATQ